MLRDLFEDEIEDSAILTDTQKKVLVKIKCASTPKTAYEDVNKDQNDIAAVDLLKSMNLVDVIGNEIAINDTGTDAMKDEGLVGEDGEVLPNIKTKYLSSDEQTSDQDMAGGPVGGEDMGAADGVPPMNPSQSGQPSQPPQPYGESFDLMREIKTQANRLSSR